MPFFITENASIAIVAIVVTKLVVIVAAVSMVRTMNVVVMVNATAVMVAVLVRVPVVVLHGTNSRICVVLKTGRSAVQIGFSGQDWC